MRFSLICVFTLILFSACQQKKNVQPDSEKADTQMVTSEESSLPRQNVTSTTLTKGKIESVREIPVYSRIAEQIVMFGVENTGQMVKKGQVLMIIEAMKMENEVLANSDGVIKQVVVSKGQSVKTGDALVVM